jgi:hypothetical protein
MALLVSGCMSQEERAALLRGPYPLQVDYGKSIEDSVRAGRYDWVNRDVTSANFPSDEAGHGMISVVLVPFSPQASLEYVLHLQAEAGQRPATLKELLAFGETYPEVQKKLPIIALGSSADLMQTIFYPVHQDEMMMPITTDYTRKIERVFPFLGGGLFGRKVNLEWLEDPEAYPMYYSCFVQRQ